MQQAFFRGEVLQYRIRILSSPCSGDISWFPEYKSSHKSASECVTRSHTADFFHLGSFIKGACSIHTNLSPVLPGGDDAHFRSRKTCIRPIDLHVQIVITGELGGLFPIEKQNINTANTFT